MPFRGTDDRDQSNRKRPFHMKNYWQKKKTKTNQKLLRIRSTSLIDHSWVWLVETRDYDKMSLTLALSPTDIREILLISRTLLTGYPEGQGIRTAWPVRFSTFDLFLWSLVVNKEKRRSHTPRLLHKTAAIPRRHDVVIWYVSYKWKAVKRFSTYQRQVENRLSQSIVVGSLSTNRLCPHRWKGWEEFAELACWS